MLDKVANQILTDGGFAGAVALLTLAALVVVWRSGIVMTNRFITHLQRAEEGDKELRERQASHSTAIVEALATLTHEMREHDHRTVALILGVRPTGGGYEEDVIHAT